MCAFSAVPGAAVCKSEPLHGNQLNAPRALQVRHIHTQARLSAVLHSQTVYSSGSAPGTQGVSAPWHPSSASLPWCQLCCAPGSGCACDLPARQLRASELRSVNGLHACSERMGAAVVGKLSLLKQRSLSNCKPHHARGGCRWMPTRCARAAAACPGASASVRAAAACCGCGSASAPVSCAAPCQ